MNRSVLLAVQDKVDKSSNVTLDIQRSYVSEKTGRSLSSFAAFQF